MLAHDLIALRAETPGLHSGNYRTIEAPKGVWAWCRGDHHAVVLNMSDDDVAMPAISGTISISTDRSRDGSSVHGDLVVRRWEGVVVEVP